MTDTILVLNAGSSSIKFSLFAAACVELAVVAQGQIEGLDTSPHFIVQDAAGQTAHEQRWAQGTQLGHDGAVAHIGDWLQETYAAQHQLAAVGHRVVHGGVDYAAPVRIDREVVAQLETLVPLRRCTSRITWRRSGACWSAGRSCHRSRASIPPFTAAIPRWRRCSRCPRS